MHFFSKLATCELGPSAEIVDGGWSIVYYTLNYRSFHLHNSTRYMKRCMCAKVTMVQPGESTQRDFRFKELTYFP